MDKPIKLPFIPIIPVTHGSDIQKESNLRAAYQPAVAPLRSIADARHQPRFKFEVNITITSHTCGVLGGRSVDISESGMAALLTGEAPLGKVVELTFAVPFGRMTIPAVVRQRNAFRYGFEFLGFVPDLIRRTCRDLALDQSLMVPVL